MSASDHLSPDQFTDDVSKHGFTHVDEYAAYLPEGIRVNRLHSHDFPLDEITVASQPKLSPELVDRYRNDPKSRGRRPIVVRPHGDELAVNNGHHAIAGARARGDKTIRAKWLPVDVSEQER